MVDSNHRQSTVIKPSFSRDTITPRGRVMAIDEALGGTQEFVLRLDRS
jgi:hypothetical protein